MMQTHAACKGCRLLLALMVLNLDNLSPLCISSKPMGLVIFGVGESEEIVGRSEHSLS